MHTPPSAEPATKAAYDRARYAVIRDRKRAQAADHYAAHRDEVLARSKERYAASHSKPVRQDWYSAHQTDIPIGLCQCGCGRATKIATKTRNDRGWVKDQPQPFVPGHSRQFIGHVALTSAERKARYKTAHPERVSYTANKHFIQAYRTTHKEAIAAYSLDYMKRIGHAVRRASKLAAPVIEKIDRRIVFERDRGRCHVCGKKLTLDTFTIDHLVPLKPPSGGPHGEHSYRNVAVACRSCNSRRHNTGPAQLRLLP